MIDLGLRRDETGGPYCKGRPRLYAKRESDDSHSAPRFDSKMGIGIDVIWVIHEVIRFGQCNGNYIDFLSDSAFWNTVRGNLETLADSKTWFDIIRNRINPVVSDGDKSFVNAAAKLLPAEPWDGATWKIWTEAVKTATDRKGKALFMPLRLALTGLDHGPELAHLMPLIGRERVLERLA